jgi:UDP-N-acetylmuramoylalanine--D-glutamate ligase
MLEVASRLGLYKITLTEKFDYAVKIATMLAGEGDCVLLSPACASYDQFSGFEERGDTFVKMVGEL